MLPLAAAYRHLPHSLRTTETKLRALDLYHIFLTRAKQGFRQHSSSTGQSPPRCAPQRTTASPVPAAARSLSLLLSTFCHTTYFLKQKAGKVQRSVTWMQTLVRNIPLSCKSCQKSVAAGGDCGWQRGSPPAGGHALPLRLARSKAQGLRLPLLLGATSLPSGCTDESFQGWKKEILTPRPSLKRSYAKIVQVACRATCYRRNVCTRTGLLRTTNLFWNLQNSPG